MSHAILVLKIKCFKNNQQCYVKQQNMGKYISMLSTIVFKNKFPFHSWIQVQILITLLESVSRLHLCNSKSYSKLLHYCDQNVCFIIDNKVERRKHCASQDAFHWQQIWRWLWSRPPTNKFQIVSMNFYLHEQSNQINEQREDSNRGLICFDINCIRILKMCI